MVDQGCEFVDILRHRAGLADIEELVLEEFMLITAKALVDQSTEGRPINRSQAVLNGLQPALSGSSEMHGGNTDPHRRFHIIHLKVI